MAPISPADRSDLSVSRPTCGHQARKGAILSNQGGKRFLITAGNLYQTLY